MSHRQYQSRKPRSTAFSLVELLVVVVIMAILMVLAMPSFTSVARGMSMTSGGQQLGDMLSQARQMAVSKNRKVEVRLFKMTEPGQTVQAYRASQIWTAKDDVGTMQSATKMNRLPSGLVISTQPQRSPMLAAPPAVAGAASYQGANYDYLAITFLADGSLANGFTATNSYFTIVNERDDVGTDTPVNFSAIRVNPVTGQVSVYRP